MLSATITPTPEKYKTNLRTIVNLNSLLIVVQEVGGGVKLLFHIFIKSILICKTFFEQWTHILLCVTVQPMTFDDVLRDCAAESIHFV